MAGNGIKNKRMNKQFWNGTNFWVAFVLAFGGLFVGFPEGDAKTTVELLFASFAGIFAIRQKVKDAKIDWAAWIKSANTRNYLFAAIVSIFPMIPGDLFTSINAIIEASIGGNWQGIGAGIFSLATILFYWLKPKQ